jgi:hypothetical protein
MLVSVMLLVAAAIHVPPLWGVLGARRLTDLYGLDFVDPSLVILMRHRAVLFGMLAAFLIFAAFRPALQPMAVVGGLVSVVTFLWLAWSVGGYNAAVARLVTADLVALVALVVAAAILALRGNPG